MICVTSQVGHTVVSYFNSSKSHVRIYRQQVVCYSVSDWCQETLKIERINWKAQKTGRDNTVTVKMNIMLNK